MDVEDFRQSLQADLVEFMRGSGLAANATSRELRENPAWPSGESGNDLTVSDFLKSGLEAPPTTPESPRWRSYTALWDSAERRLPVAVSDSPESIVVDERFVRAVRRRLHALVARRDDQHVLALLDVAWGDVMRWRTEGDDQWVGYVLEGLRDAQSHEIVKDLIEFDDQEVLDFDFLPSPLVTYQTDRTDDPEAWINLDAVIDLAGLVTRAPIRPFATVVFRQGIKPNPKFEITKLSERGGCWLKRGALTNEAADNIAALFDPWIQYGNLLEPSRRAFVNAVLAVTQYDTVAWCIAAIESESLLGYGRSDARKRPHIGRAARIYTPDPTRRKYIRKLLYCLHRDVRNPTFHPQPTEGIQAAFSALSASRGRTESEVAEEVLELTSRLILETLKALASGETLQSYIASIDARSP